MTCRELVGFLDDYLAGALPEPSRAAFNAHLSDCPPCVAYMKTYAASIRMGRAVLRSSDDGLPDDVPEELVRAVLSSRTKP